MSATDDVARMLTLIPWLLERPGASLAETADAFGVSETTIQRDLVQRLDFCGLPGLGGGDLFDVSLVGDRVLVTMADELRRPLRPTPADALRLVLALDAVAEVLADELPALRTGVDAVRRALGVPEHLADVVDPPVSAVALDARRAIGLGRVVRLRYQGRGDDTPRDREVEPFAVRIVGGAWYLQGQDVEVDELRTFRLDRVRQLTVTDQVMHAEPPIPLPEPRYRPGPKDVAVVLHLDRGARWLIEALDAVEDRDVGDGATEVRFTTDAPGHVQRLVLMAGGAAQVVEPPALAAAVHAAAVAAAERYT